MFGCQSIPSSGTTTRRRRGREASKASSVCLPLSLSGNERMRNSPTDSAEGAAIFVRNSKLTQPRKSVVDADCIALPLPRARARVMEAQ